MHIPQATRAHKRLALVVLVPLALVATLLIRPTIAFAGAYTVHTCQTPAGTFTGNGGWTSTASAPVQGQDPGLVLSCTQDGSAMRLRYAAQMPVAPGHELRWSFVAPLGTSISSLLLHRTIQLGWPVVSGRYARPYIYELWHDSEGAENQLEFELPPYDGDTAGIEYPPAFQGDGVSWGSVHVRLSCWPLVGSLDCGPFPAQVTISRAQIGLADTSTPGGFATGGALMRADPVRGVAGLSVHVFDAGGGVYRVALSVDGDEVARQVVDDAGGTCADAEPSNDDPYEFGTSRPCPLAADGTVQLDTTAFRDGQHAVRATVEDAGGNAALVFDGTVQTHNAPISTVAPAISGDARVDGALTADIGQWDGAPTGYGHRWLRCDADGAACSAVAGADGAAYTPTAADAYHRMRLEVTAENASGAATARSAPSGLVADVSGRTAPALDVSQGGGGSGASAGAIQGIVNPLAQLPGHVGNGGGATTHARMTVAFQRADGSTAHRVTLSAGRRIAIVGRLTDAGGAGIADARVGAAWRIVGRGWVARPGLRTGPDGRFVYVLPAGPSRDVRFTYFAFSDSRAVELSNVVRVDARAPLTIRADRGHVTGDRLVRLSGRVGAGPIPRAGLLVTLQGYQSGYGWRTFRTVRTDRHGRWRTSYRFRSSQGRFGFRAVVPRQGRFPFASSRSAGVFVVVG